MTRGLGPFARRLTHWRDPLEHGVRQQQPALEKVARHLFPFQRLHEERAREANPEESQRGAIYRCQEPFRAAVKKVRQELGRPLRTRSAPVARQDIGAAPSAAVVPAPLEPRHVDVGAESTAHRGHP
jgi:hypothetical protein